MLQYVLFPAQDATTAPQSTPLSLPTAAPSSSSLLVASAAATAAVADDDNQRGLKSSPKSSSKPKKKAKALTLTEELDDDNGDDVEDDDDSRDYGENTYEPDDFLVNDDDPIDYDHYPHSNVQYRRLQRVPPIYVRHTRNEEGRIDADDEDDDDFYEKLANGTF